jgi:hypothetical protein
MRIEEVDRISHCDDCDMGQFGITCPICGSRFHTCDHWYDLDEIQDGETRTITCDSCKGKIEIFWDPKEVMLYSRPFENVL